MGLIQRLPDWLSEDRLVRTLNSIIDEKKISSYYNFLRKTIKQPLQIKPIYKKITIEQTDTYINWNDKFTIKIENPLGYPTYPIFILKENGTPKNRKAIYGPIEILWNNKKLIIDADLPQGTLEIHKDKLLLNGKDIRYKKISGEKSTKYFEFGNISTHKRLFQHFKITEKVDFFKFYIINDGALPTANILVNLYEKENLLESKVLNQSDIANCSIYEVIFDSGYEAGEYILDIKLSGVYAENTGYKFLSAGQNSYQELYIYEYKDGEYHISPVSENIYMEFYIDRYKGEYPILDSSLETIEIRTNKMLRPASDDEIECFGSKECCDINISYKCYADIILLDKIKVRGTSIRHYPLKKLQIYDKNNKIIYTKEYRKEKRYICKEETISADSLNIKAGEPLILEGEWHFISETKRIGFPVSYSNKDPIFRPNKALDYIGEFFKIPRQNYKKTFKIEEYSETEPLGYIYDTEQDWDYENRLINEYYYRESENEYFKEEYIPEEYIYEDFIDIEYIPSTDAFKKKTFYNTGLKIDTYLMKGINKEFIGIIKPKKIIRKPIQINYHYGEGHHLEIVTTQQTLKFNNSNLYKLEEDVNSSQEYISLKIYNNIPGESFSINFATNGLYKTFGLLSSEVFHSTNRIPYIKDMWEYVLTYDINEYNNYLWGGELYSAASFRVDIPAPIPKNLEGITTKEINNKIKRTKKFGTTGFSTFWYNLEPMKLNVSINSEINKTGLSSVNISFPLFLNLYNTDHVSILHFTPKYLSKLTEFKTNRSEGLSINLGTKIETLRRFITKIQPFIAFEKNTLSNNIYTTILPQYNSATFITKEIKIQPKENWYEAYFSEKTPENTSITKNFYTEKLYYKNEQASKSIPFGTKNSQRIRQDIKAPLEMSSIKLKIEKVGNPTDSIQIKLLENNNKVFEQEYSSTEDSFIIPISTQKGLKYTIEISRTGVLDENNFYKITTSNDITDSPAVVQTSLTWNKLKTPIYYEIYEKINLLTTSEKYIKINNLPKQNIRIMFKLYTKDRINFPRIENMKIYTQKVM